MLLLPGLATDPQILAPQIEAFGDALHTPLWLQPHRHESLPEYAERFGRMLRPTLDDGRVWFLGGVSFGGMVAYEMARVLRPRAVLLIASCRTGRAIPRWLVLAERLGLMAPDAAVGALRPVMARLLAGMERLQGDQRRLLLEVASRVDPSLVRWSARACVRWRSHDEPPHDTPVFHLHGDRDPVIPLRHVEATDVVPGGRHLIHLTHADRANAWIACQIETALGAPPRSDDAAAKLG